MTEKIGLSRFYNNKTVRNTQLNTGGVLSTTSGLVVMVSYTDITLYPKIFFINSILPK